MEFNQVGVAGLERVVRSGSPSVTTAVGALGPQCQRTLRAGVNSGNPLGTRGFPIPSDVIQPGLTYSPPAVERWAVHSLHTTQIHSNLRVYLRNRFPTANQRFATHRIRRNSESAIIATHCIHCNVEVTALFLFLPTWALPNQGWLFPL